MNDLLRRARAALTNVLPEIVDLRHALHQHPEIRFEERWTSDRIAAFLDAVRIPYRRGYAGGTGIVATLDGGGSRTVALRADMDALEIAEETGLSYASRIAGHMHACGHDGHVACLCGAARVLASLGGELGGRVKFIFQPAEEISGGGRILVEEGALDGVDAAFALHAWPAIPAGKIGLKSGPMMASADWFAITIQGRGAHGADPAAAIDPVVVAAHVTTALQTIVSREINAWDAAVVTVARIEAGGATNVIPDIARLEGTLRALAPDVRDTVARAVERIAVNVARAFRAEATVTFGDERYAPLVNDPGMTELARGAITEALGADAVVEIEQPSMASEDFAFYLEKVPGSFLRLGNADPAGGVSPPLHSPRFDFNDAALPAGVMALTAIALRFLHDE